MPQTIYRVRLSDAEREHLEQLLRGGTTATRQLTRGRILLKAAEGWPDERITEALTVGRATVERTRRRFVECGLEALRERPRPGQRPKARLIAEACSAALEGRQHWTLQLLADRVVALGLTESCPSAAEKNAAKKRQEKQPYVRYYLPRHSRIGRVGKLFFSVVVFIES